jgi:hypothetical protein
LFQVREVDGCVLMQGESTAPVAVDDAVNYIALSRLAGMIPKISVQGSQFLDAPGWYVQVVLFISLESSAIALQIWC